MATMAVSRNMSRGGTTRLRLQCDKKPTASKLAEIMNTKIGLAFMECYQMKGKDDMYIARCTLEESEKLQSQECAKKLKKEGIVLITTPEAKARRTVICKNVSKEITDYTSEAIIEELQEFNPWAKINHVFEFNNGRNLKIEFQEEKAANKALECGLTAFHLRIPNFNIEKDTFIPIIQCRDCYKLGHEKKDCKDEKVWCSECGKTGHRFSDCVAKKKCCLLCKEEHSAMNIKCPAKREYIKTCRRELEKNKRKNLQYSSNDVQPGISFADKLKSNKNKPTTIDTPYNLQIGSSKQHIQITTCIILAHLSSNGDVTKFQNKLDHALSINDLPSVKIDKNLLLEPDTLRLSTKQEKTNLKLKVANTPPSPNKRKNSPNDDCSIVKMQACGTEEDQDTGDEEDEKTSEENSDESEPEASLQQETNLEEDIETEMECPTPPPPISEWIQKVSSPESVKQMEEENRQEYEEQMKKYKLQQEKNLLNTSQTSNTSARSLTTPTVGQKMDGRLFDLVYKLHVRKTREELNALTHEDFLRMYDNQELELKWNKEKINETKLMRWFNNGLLKNMNYHIPQASPKKKSPKKKSPKKSPKTKKNSE
jgi:hypothetical protein